MTREQGAATADKAVEGYALSPQQRRWWESTGGDGPSGRVTVAVEGPVDIERLRAALIGEARCHDTLRTRFVRLGAGEVIQVVEDDAPVELRVPDQSPPGNTARGGPVTGLLASLESWAPDRHTLTIETPPGAADGVSLCVLTEQVVARYDRRPPKEPLQYTRFDMWQQGASEGTDPGALLPSADKVVTLTAPPDAVALTERVVRVTRLDAAPLRARLDTDDLPAALLAHWCWFVARRTGTEAPVVGYRHDGRVFDELADVVGLLTRTVPIQVSAAPDAPVASAVREVRDTLDRITEWQTEWAWPGTGPAVEACPPVQFEFVRHPGPMRVGGTTFTVTGVRACCEPADVRLVVHEGGGTVEAELHVRREADEPTVRDLAEGFAATLGAVVTGGPADDLPVMGEREWRTVRSWGRSGEDARPDAEPVSARIAGHARTRPDAEAVVDGDRSIRYAELHADANRAAAGLCARGVGPEEPVALFGRRSAGTVVAMLGVLRSGGAFVPLDADQPDEVLRRIAADLDLCLAVCAAGESGRARDLGLDPVTLTELLATPLPSKEVLPKRPPRPDALAYVVLTSGSTGWPKGVAVTHGNLTHYVDAVARRFGFRAGASHATIAGPAADLGYTATFGALATGGTLHVLTRECLLDPEAYAHYQRTRPVDFLKTTPSHARALVAEAAASGPPLRGLVILGGETLDAELLDRLTASLPDDGRVVNHYGPAETCVGVTAQSASGTGGAQGGRTDQRSTGTRRTVPLGTPLGGNRVHLLDERMRAVPAGVPGEIWVGGPGVSRGYLGQPALTAARFRPDPYADRPGARLYRTGDLARWTPEGELVFLGRLDDQVKIRGYRVEPAAVHRQVLDHPAVGQAAVIVREDADAEPCLAAYLVLDDEYCRGQSNRLADEQVADWTTVFESVYGSDGGGPAPLGSDQTGWDSSYTGEPMKAAEIAESVDGIVGRVAALPHEEMLEVGCGTGLLLARLAPSARRYCATDISSAVLQRVARGMAADPERYRSVELSERAADDFTGFPDGCFDLVLLNSVIQYFPSAEYLWRVLGEAVRVTRPGGHVIVGDVRDGRLLETFQSCVALAHAGPDTPAGEVVASVRAACQDEGELLLEPAWFASAAALLPAITRVEVQLKRGRIANELTKFRYDAVLRVGAAADDDPNAWEALPWPSAGSPAEVERRVRAGGDHLLILDVPDARVVDDVVRWETLRAAPHGTAAGPPADRSVRAAEHPDVWWELGERLGRTVEVSPARSGRLGHYDVAVSESGRVPSRDLRYDVGTGTLVRGGLTASWRRYCSRPEIRRFGTQVFQDVRRHLKDRLPDYMVPAHMAVVDDLPLTAAGKLDVGALPRPAGRQTGADEYVAPRTPVEEIVAEVWADVLGVEKVSACDDFFDLGGHSLLVVQVVYRLREALGAEITLRQFFDDPTVAGVGLLVTRTLMDDSDL